MNREARPYLLVILLSTVFSVGVWALLRYTPLIRQANKTAPDANQPSFSDAANLRKDDPDLWAPSMEKVKEDRAETEKVALEIPPELRHYEDRHWFLATQVAEVKKLKLQPVQDFVDLAGMISRGEVVPVPAVTDTYILFGVGARVDGSMFTRYVANQNLELNDEAGLRDAYARLDTAHANLQKEISALQTELAALKKGAATQSDDLQKEITARQQEIGRASCRERV